VIWAEGATLLGGPSARPRGAAEPPGCASTGRTHWSARWPEGARVAAARSSPTWRRAPRSRRSMVIDDGRLAGSLAVGRRLAGLAAMAPTSQRGARGANYYHHHHQQQRQQKQQKRLTPKQAATNASHSREAPTRRSKFAPLAAANCLQLASWLAWGQPVCSQREPVKHNGPKPQQSRTINDLLEEEEQQNKQEKN